MKGKILALPLVYTLSRMVWLVGIVGGLLNPSPLFSLIFDRIIGIDKAELIRNEHAEALIGAVEAREIDYGESKQVLIEKTREGHQESLSRISRGESILSISIALVAVFVEEIPRTVELPMDISLPIPSLETILLLFTVVLICSVFLRETAIEALSFDSPSVFDSHDELMTKWAWNEGAVPHSLLSYNTLLLQVIRDWDERHYENYLDLIATFVESDDFSKIDALQEYWTRSYQVAQQSEDSRG